MAKSETSDDSENSSEEAVTAKESGGGIRMNKKISDYEKQRMKRIEENRARMEALGLKSMAKSLSGSVQNVKKKSVKNGKRKIDDDDDDDDDDDYRPAEDDELQGLGSSAEEDNKDDDDVDDEDEDFTMSRKSKGKKKTTKPKKASPKKRVRKHVPYGTSGYVDDDDALMQAIAMSLQDSAVFAHVKTQALQSSSAQIVDNSSIIKKGNTQIQEDKGKRKRKKTISNRVQMTEDEVILYFFQFDEAGKGNITLRDLQRLAAVHDFMWLDKEMADMINCFDSDGDGKLSLDDFHKIVGRCNMIQVPENTVTGNIS